MANKTTFTGFVRSNGGDQDRITYAGSIPMVAQFYVANAAASTTDVQISSTNTDPVILPEGAIVDMVLTVGAATGGSSPTIDLGVVDYDGGTDIVDTDGLGDNFRSDINARQDVASGQAGTLVANQTKLTERAKVTATVGTSAPTGGTLSGVIYYHIQDDGTQSS
jgi:hypothetical protein